MSISDSTLAAYMAGVSTVQEDKQVLNEISNNKYFSDLLDVMEDIDVIDGMDELRNEFNEFENDFIEYKEWKELKTKIK